MKSFFLLIVSCFFCFGFWTNLQAMNDDEGFLREFIAGDIERLDRQRAFLERSFEELDAERLEFFIGRFQEAIDYAERFADREEEISIQGTLVVAGDAYSDFANRARELLGQMERRLEELQRDDEDEPEEE